MFIFKTFNTIGNNIYAHFNSLIVIFFFTFVVRQVFGELKCSYTIMPEFFRLTRFHMQTEKTMAELELDLNQRTGEWSLLQETGTELKLVYGPGLTGMYNLGNSCFMNSVMQVLMTIPEFGDRYVVFQKPRCQNWLKASLRSKIAKIW